MNFEEEDRFSDIERRINALDDDSSHYTDKLMGFEERYSSLERTLMRQDAEYKELFDKLEAEHSEVTEALNARLSILEKENAKKRRELQDKTEQITNSEFKRLRNMVIMASLAALLGSIGGSLLAPLLGTLAGCL